MPPQGREREARLRARSRLLLLVCKDGSPRPRSSKARFVASSYYLCYACPSSRLITHKGGLAKEETTRLVRNRASHAELPADIQRVKGFRSVSCYRCLGRALSKGTNAGESPHISTLRCTCHRPGRRHIRLSAAPRHKRMALPLGLDVKGFSGLDVTEVEDVEETIWNAQSVPCWRSTCMAVTYPFNICNRHRTPLPAYPAAIHLHRS